MATKQMGTIELSVTETRRRFLELAQRVPSERGVVRVTKHGRPLLAVTPWEDYEKLMEIVATIEVMSDPDFMAQIRQGDRELAEGRGIELSELETMLALDHARSNTDEQ